MEEWVRKVAEKSGQKVDWHYSGGSRIMVKVIGRVSPVRSAIKELMSEHDQLFKRAAKKHGIAV